MVESDRENCTIFIVGSQMLLNGLMASHIRESTGIQCQSCRVADLSLQLKETQDLSRGLVLLDCHCDGPSKLRSGFCDQALIEKPGLYFCLFNVSPSEEMEIEQEAFHQGIRGIFYQNDPLTILGKGILAVLSGELWFSREALTRCLLNQRSTHRRGGESPGEITLTMRERQILTMIASGLTNEEIALKLNLSGHTVKTHAYNIYKKINVPNRIQASLWVAQYLA